MGKKKKQADNAPEASSKTVQPSSSHQVKASESTQSSTHRPRVETKPRPSASAPAADETAETPKSAPETQHHAAGSHKHHKHKGSSALRPLRAILSRVFAEKGRRMHWVAAVLVVAAGALFLKPALEDSGLPGVMKDVITPHLPPLLDNINSLLGISGINATLSMESLNSNWKALLTQLPAFATGAASGSSAAGGGTPSESYTRPGLAMAAKGYRAKHPVVILPGFITSGLELWEGRPCARRYFRQRMWGTLAMVQAFLSDPQCWFQHMELDPVTGLDPNGIKLRAAMGLEAVDYFIQGYWVWSKLVEALADVGYDSNTLVSMAYDWRLAMPLLEVRDGYFSRVKASIETLTDTSGLKVVIAVHSFGENVARSFFHWVDSSHPGWVEQHVEALINIAGTSLGAPKSIPALLSGETKDTAQLGALAGYLTTNMVPRATRTRLWRTWGSGYAMLPVGGTAVWGNSTWAPDDTPQMRAAHVTYGAMATVWPHDWQDKITAVPISGSIATGPSPAAPAGNRSKSTTSTTTITSNKTSTGEAASGSTAAADAAAAAATADALAAEMLAAGAVTPSTAAAMMAAGGSGGDNASAAAANATMMAAAAEATAAAAAAAGAAAVGLADRLRRMLPGGDVPVTLGNIHHKELERRTAPQFIDLLAEAAGSTVASHIKAWSATTLPSKEAQEQGSSLEKDASRAEGTAQEQQALGGTSGTARRRASKKPPVLFPDATTTPLPHAPSLKIVCLYGVGIPTERAYHYVRPAPGSGPAPAPAPASAPAPAAGAAAAAAAAAVPSSQEGGSLSQESSSQGDDAMRAAGGDAVSSNRTTNAAGRSSDGDGCGVGGDGGGSGGEGAGACSNPDAVAGGPAQRDTDSAASDIANNAAGWHLHTDASDPSVGLDVGVLLSDGDGTVPLISLGLMCRKGWRSPRLNPGGSRVVTREYKHSPVTGLLQDSRGGPAVSDHVSILGNEAMLMDVIRVAAGRSDELRDEIISEIDRIGANVEF